MSLSHVRKIETYDTPNRRQMPVIRMRYSVSSGFLVLVLLLCNEAWVVQAADSGASVSPSAPGFPSALTTYSSTSYMDTMTVTSPTEEASFTSQLKYTPVSSSSPQPSASSSAVAEVMTSSAVSTTLPLPSSSQEPPPKKEGKYVCMSAHVRI